MGSAVSSPDATAIDITQAREYAGHLWTTDLEEKFKNAAVGGDASVSLGELKILAPELFKSKNLLIIGAGPGISGSVARKFGGQGYKVSLVSLVIEDAQKEEEALKKSGIAAFSFACDAKDEVALRKVCREAREQMGSISAVLCNCYDLGGGDPLAEGSAAAILDNVSVAITSILASVQECRADLKANSGLFLVTTSGIGATDIPPPMEEFVVGLGMTGYCVAKAAQQKLTNQLAVKLKPDGIFVGMVYVNGMVKGTKFDDGSGAAKVDPDIVSEAFWKLAQERTESSTKIE